MIMIIIIIIIIVIVVVVIAVVVVVVVVVVMKIKTIIISLLDVILIAAFFSSLTCLVHLFLFLPSKSFLVLVIPIYHNLQVQTLQCRTY